MSGDLGYPNEAWEEIIDGKTVALFPRPLLNHNQIAGNLGFLFANYIKGRPKHSALRC